MSIATREGQIISGEELKALQAILLEMLLEVDRICRKNEINYCLFMGTMLGAVRHNGFIPWDDDLDIGMLQPEYEKFRAACIRDLDESRFFFQDHTTDPEYRWAYGRIRRVGSEFVRAGQEHMKMKTGIFMDIFPLVATPDFPVARAIHCFYCYALRKLLYADLGRKSARSTILRLWYGLLALVPHRWTLRLVEQLAMTRGRTRLVRIIGFPTPSRGPRGYRREWLEHRKEMAFEGHLFPVSQDHDGYLTYSYGDYTRLPPAEQRVPSHPAAKFHLP